MDEAELARIRFVTSRYRDLQGLRQVAIVPLCLMLFWLQPYLRLLRYQGPVEAIAGLILSVLPCLLIAAVHPLLDRYYARRFGSVAASEFWQWDTVGPAVLLIGGVLADAFVVGHRGPSATVVALGMLSLHTVVRDWPWRAHHLLVTFACVAGTWMGMVLPIPPGDVAAGELTAFLRITLTSVLFAYGAAGYLDHRLLVRTMPVHPEASAELDADHADPI